MSRPKGTRWQPCEFCGRPTDLRKRIAGHEGLHTLCRVHAYEDEPSPEAEWRRVVDRRRAVRMIAPVPAISLSGR